MDIISMAREFALYTVQKSFGIWMENDGSMTKAVNIIWFAIMPKEPGIPLNEVLEAEKHSSKSA